MTFSSDCMFYHCSKIANFRIDQMDSWRMMAFVLDSSSFFAVRLLLLLWLLHRRVFILNFMNESVRARTGPSVYWKYDLPLSWIESNEIESIRAWYVIISRTHPHQWSTDWWKLRTSLRKKNIAATLAKSYYNHKKHIE